MILGYVRMTNGVKWRYDALIFSINSKMAKMFLLTETGR